MFEHYKNTRHLEHNSRYNFLSAPFASRAVSNVTQHSATPSIDNSPTPTMPRRVVDVVAPRQQSCFSREARTEPPREIFAAAATFLVVARRHSIRDRSQTREHLPAASKDNTLLPLRPLPTRRVKGALLQSSTILLSPLSLSLSPLSLSLTRSLSRKEDGDKRFCTRRASVSKDWASEPAWCLNIW